MRRVGLVGMVVGVVLGVLAAPASAAPQLVATAAGLNGGPHLAGEQLFYGEIGSRGLLLTLDGPNHAKRRLHTAAIPGDSFSEEVSPGDYSFVHSELAASVERLAFGQASGSGNARYQQGVSSLKVLGGAVGGGLAELASCSNSDYYSPANPTVDVDGFVTAATDCTGAIVIRDHTPGAEATKTVSPGQGLAAGAIAIAGRYVAYTPYPANPYSPTTPGSTVVYDWVADQKVYEVARQPGFDLQADGTLAGVSPQGTSCSQGKLAWFSPAEPTEHVLPVTPCDTAVRIANGRIAVTTRADAERRLTLVDLDGTRTHAANLGPAGMQRGAHDFDGTKVSYALANCLGRIDLLTESAANPEPRPEATPCPVRIRSGSATLAPKDRTIPLFLECLDGCNALAIVRMRLGGKLVNVGSTRARIAPPEGCVIAPGTAYLKLASPARREIRRRGSVRADLIVLADDRAGRTQRTKRKLRIEAAATGVSSAQAPC